MILVEDKYQIADSVDQRLDCTFSEVLIYAIPKVSNGKHRQRQTLTFTRVSLCKKLCYNSQRPSSLKDVQ